MRERDIVVTGLQSWDIKIGSNCKNIASEFSKHNRVLYVNPPLDRATVKRDPDLELFYRTAGDGMDAKVNEPRIKKVQENLWVLYPQNKLESISRLPVNILFDWLNKNNNKLFAADIKKGMDSLNFRNHIHFCDSDMFRSFHLKELLHPEVFIYYTRDNLLAVKYWQVQGKRIEPAIMEKADIVLANSTYLAHLASVHNKMSYFVGQGCDLSAFDRAKVSSLPGDVKSIPSPVIGYIGALKTLRLDISILEHLARERPGWSIVLVGPEDEAFKASELHNMGNVYFTGGKPGEELPAYLMSFNVAVNPQVLNEVTRGNYPRKIDEYLAMGKPTVATLTEAMDYFSEHVSLASDNASWLEAVESELDNNTKEKEKARIGFAAEHTWENNVKNIYEKVMECCDIEK